MRRSIKNSNEKSSNGQICESINNGNEQTYGSVKNSESQNRYVLIMRRSTKNSNKLPPERETSVMRRSTKNIKDESQTEEVSESDCETCTESNTEIYSVIDENYFESENYLIINENHFESELNLNTKETHFETENDSITEKEQFETELDLVINNKINPNTKDSFFDKSLSLMVGTWTGFMYNCTWTDLISNPIPTCLWSFLYGSCFGLFNYAFSSLIPKLTKQLLLFQISIIIRLKYSIIK